MDSSELKIIKQLMMELQDEMKLSEDDFGERLGRKKPEVEMIKIESKEESPELEAMEDESLEEDMDSGLEEMVAEESPEDKLKQRLMKLRG